MNSSSGNTPLVSIGMPVYQPTSKFGSDELFRKNIESLLAQDYPNIELVISDNGSTDTTYQVCEEYARKDSRIRLYRNEQNMGIHYNFQRVYDLAAGRYYMWAADDDHWEPNFVSACVQQLEAHPEADLCFPLFMEHNLVKGTEYERCLLVDDSIEEGWRRAAHIIQFKIRPHVMIMGMFRREAIADILPIKVMMNGDLVFLYEFAFKHRYIRIPDVLGHKYVRPKNVDNAYSAQIITIPTLSRIKAAFHMVGELVKITLQADISFVQKIRCLWTIVMFFAAGIIFVATLHKVRI